MGDRLDVPQGHPRPGLILTILTARTGCTGTAPRNGSRCSATNSFQVNPGSLFPSLYRLEQDGKLKAEWRPSENDRNAKYYRLTAVRQKDSWSSTNNAGTDRVCHYECAGGRMDRLFNRLASVVRWLLRRNTVELELDNELQSFLDLSVRGEDPPRAFRQSRRATPRRFSSSAARSR